jgi:flagellar hook-basal body complex protein FliE
MVRVPMTGVAGVAGLGELAGGGAAGGGFAEALDAAVKSVDARQTEADELMRGLATGENVDLHSTMIALEEANIALRAMGSVRDKVVDAYQSIWNMPI